MTNGNAWPSIPAADGNRDTRDTLHLYLKLKLLLRRGTAST